MTSNGSEKKRVAILISGRGSNMMSLVEAAKAADYPAEITIVISNRPDAPGLEWAKAQGIPAIGLDHNHYEDRPHFESQLTSILETSNIDLIACAGFMRLLTAEFVTAWLNRMLNIHPSLLPLFKGLNTHERAIAAGVRIAGCTVHVVRPEMDEGPILGQAAVRVSHDDTPDTLAKRVLNAEHRLYPEILAQFAAGQITVQNNKVTVAAPENESLDAAALYSPAC